MVVGVSLRKLTRGRKCCDVMGVLRRGVRTSWLVGVRHFMVGFVCFVGCLRRWV